MSTIVRLSRTARHHEDVLLVERIEPENESQSTFILPIDDGSLRIEVDSADVSRLIERDTPKRPTSIIKTEDGAIGKCKVCGRYVQLFEIEQLLGIEWLYCPTCGHRLGWSE